MSVKKRRILHLMDDMAMGGVTRALKNFEHLELAELGQHETVDVTLGKPVSTSANDVAIIHFTASWRKLPKLVELRYRQSFNKIILIEHTYTSGFEASEVDEPVRFRQMLRFAYRMVDIVVAVSAEQRRWMIEAKLAPAAKIIAIPQARDCTHLLRMMPAEREAGPLRIGAFGRFHKQKGFDLLIEAMALIPTDIAQLEIAGAGENAQTLKAMAMPLANVKISPPFSDPEAFLSRTDIVAAPSRWEAFGLVGLEARAAGRAIIAAEIDGLIDQIGESGFGHEPNCVDALEAAIRKAASAKDIDQRGLLARKEAYDAHANMLEGWKALLAEPDIASRAA